MTLENYAIQTKPAENYQDLDRTISPEDVSKVLAIMYQMQKKEEVVKQEEQKELDLKNHKTEMKQFLEDFCKENPETNSKYIDEAVNMFYDGKAVGMQFNDSQNEKAYLSALKEMGRKTFKGVRFASAIFWFPTYIRTYARENINSNNIGDVAFITLCPSCVSSTGLLLAGKLIGLPENLEIVAFATPYLTNTLSFIYEWFRYEKNKIQNIIETKV